MPPHSGYMALIGPFWGMVVNHPLIRSHFLGETWHWEGYWPLHWRSFSTPLATIWYFNPCYQPKNAMLKTPKPFMYWIHPECIPKCSMWREICSRVFHVSPFTAFHQETRQPLPLSQEGKSFESVFCTSFTPWYEYMLLNDFGWIFWDHVTSPVGTWYTSYCRSRVLK